MGSEPIHLVNEHGPLQSRLCNHVADVLCTAAYLLQLLERGERDGGGELGPTSVTLAEASDEVCFVVKHSLQFCRCVRHQCCRLCIHLVGSKGREGNRGKGAGACLEHRTAAQGCWGIRNRGASGQNQADGEHYYRHGIAKGWGKCRSRRRRVALLLFRGLSSRQDRLQRVKEKCDSPCPA